MAERGWLLGWIAVASVVAALLVPAASAKSSVRVHLSLIPLPRSSLGPAASGLRLAYDSGVLSNKRESQHAFFGAANLKGVGRISGYALDYGNAASGLPGVDSVWTSVDEYKNARDAKSALSFWHGDDAQVSLLNSGGLSVTFGRVKASPVGSARFASLTSYSASNIAPVSGFDEWFTDGRYLLDVRVAAGTSAAAESVGRKLASKLDLRLGRALKGHLRATRVTLPRRPKPGPPVGGPNLSAIALAPTDLSSQATVAAALYPVQPPGLQPDYTASSDYFLEMKPASPFHQLSQDIEWFPTANEASFFADRWMALETKVSPLTLNLSSVGDNARGIFVLKPSGNAGALITFSTGQLAEVLQLSINSAVPGSEITNVAQTAANRINAAYSG